MLVVMRHDAAAEDIQRVVATIEELGYQARPMPGKQRTTVGLVGNDGRVDGSRLAALPGVAEIIHVTQPYKQVSREWKAEATQIRLAGGVVVGGDEVVVMAGPCSVESESQILAAAHAVRDAGATILRAGAFKPRSSPYSFQGLGRPGLALLKKAREETGLLIVTEAMDPEGADQVAEVADIIQVGARNMQNQSLLKRVGRLRRPVLLKRGLSATIVELLMAAEYIMAHGNTNVVLCERGIRTFERATRNTLDVSAVPVLQRETHLPVIIDPSHAGGDAALVAPLAFAGIAAGADGLIIEVHPEPESALSDGDQSLAPPAFVSLMGRLSAFAAAAGRTMSVPVTAPELVESVA